MRPIDVVRRVAPHARAEYLAAFEDGDALIGAAGITTPARLAHFLAQVLEETGGLTITQESGNYSAPRIVEVWPSRFHGVAEAEPFAHNAEKLFNNVYAGRMGNGPAASGDGFRYRGRGILQTTGREAYRKYGKRCGVDFEGNPDLIFAAAHALKPALAEWTDSGCNALADRDDIHAITKRINGGYTGFAERVHWLHVVKPIIDKVELRPGAYAAPLSFETAAPFETVAVAPSSGRPPQDEAPHGEEPRSRAASRTIEAKHVSAGGSLIATIAAAWQSIASGVSWPLVALIVVAGLLVAAHFLNKPRKG